MATNTPSANRPRDAISSWDFEEDIGFMGFPRNIWGLPMLGDSGLPGGRQTAAPSEDRGWETSRPHPPHPPYLKSGFFQSADFAIISAGGLIRDE